MQSESVLRRKLGGGRAAEAGEGLEKPFRLALARAAQATPAFRIDIARVTEAPRSLPEVLELLPERALLAMLEGPGEALGLVALDPAFLSALIEAMTTGRIGPVAPAPRKPTRTDAAMAAELVEATMRGFEAELAETADFAWASGFRYASFLEDRRPLALLLEDAPHRVLQAEVQMGPERSGTLLAALPAEPHHSRGAKSPPPPQAPPRTVEAVALLAEAELTAVLDRIALPISAVLALKPGDMLPLPNAAIDAIAIEGADGIRRGEGKLGQNRGNRAVRLGAHAIQQAGPGEAAAPPPAFSAGPLPLAGAAQAEEQEEETAEAEETPQFAVAMNMDLGAKEGEEAEGDLHAEPLPMAINPIAMTG